MLKESSPVLWFYRFLFLRRNSESHGRLIIKAREKQSVSAVIVQRYGDTLQIVDHNLLKLAWFKSEVMLVILAPRQGLVYDCFYN